MAQLASGRVSQFWKRMELLLGSDSECQKLFEALTQLVESKGARAFRLNPLRGGLNLELVQSFGFHPLRAVPWCNNGYFADFTKVVDLAAHPVVGAGLLYMQEPGAMEAVELLAPEPGDEVLDLCAAPGAKATQIGEKLKGQGWLVANDPVKARAERLAALVARHGITNSSLYSLDPTNLAQRFSGAFNKILVDAPCSGESLLAKRIDHRSDVRDVDVKGAARRQFLILGRAAEMLRGGGRLLYSTCTYSREENEDIANAFLEAHPSWKLLHQQRRWPHIDGVAGGYLALFQAPEQWQPPAAPKQKASKFSESKNDETKGLIRKGVERWNGEIDVYAQAMSAFSASETPASIRLNFEQARSYLRGESLQIQSPARGLVTFEWDSYSLGPGKAIEGRVNNLLPKILRPLS